MTPEQELRQKLRKIEALFAGATTGGERIAAGAAAERIRDRLGHAAGKEKQIEVKFSISDTWSRQLFVALCRRYGLRPFRYRRMHRQTIIIKAPKGFVEQSCGLSSKSWTPPWSPTSPRSPRRSFGKRYMARQAMPMKSTKHHGSGDDVVSSNSRLIGGYLGHGDGGCTGT